MKKVIWLSWVLLSQFSFSQKTKNILFIAFDDLKPMLGCYNDAFVKSPNIDAFAQNAMVFTNAHCQQAVCGPSRASILTGTRPDYTGVWDLATRMRDVNPSILSIPEYFRNNGFETVAVGKLYDPRCVDKENDEPSWSIPYAESNKFKYPDKYGTPGLSYYASPENQGLIKKYTEEAKEKNVNVYNYVSKFVKPSTECADVEDDAYIDTQIVNNALQYLDNLSKSEKPFFLAVGFKRPHLPFAAPKKYWDMYNREAIELASFRDPIKNGVDYAYSNMGEMKAYTDIPPLTDFTDIFNHGLPESKQKELIHGYMACVSYVDYQFGRLIAALKEKGLDKNTTIVVWGDHGWHLGDHSLWCKHTNFEQATRVPLIIATPDSKGGYNASPVEIVDVFPTLCKAAGLEIPSQLQGKSLLPIVEGKAKKVKDFAVSQFDREDREGYSIRTDRYRLTLWIKNKYRTFEKFDESLIESGELYDYKKDPLETENFYQSKSYKKIKAKLIKKFVQFAKTQNQELKNSNAAEKLALIRKGKQNSQYKNVYVE